MKLAIHFSPYIASFIYYIRRDAPGDIDTLRWLYYEGALLGSPLCMFEYAMTLEEEVVEEEEEFDEEASEISGIFSSTI